MYKSLLSIFTIVGTGKLLFKSNGNHQYYFRPEGKSMTVAIYPFLWGMTAWGGKGHTSITCSHNQYFYIVSSTDLVISIFLFPDRVSAIREKKIVLYYHILTLNRSLLLTDDPSQTLAARILAPSYSWTLIECVGGWCHKGLPRDLKASRKTIEIDLLQSCDDNSSAECLCQLTFSSLKGLAARVKSAYSLSILTKQPRIQCTCFLVS